MKILVTPTSLQPGKNEKALSTLRNFSEDLVFNSTGKPLSDEDLIPLLDSCDGIIAGLDSISRKVIDACPDLKVISRYGAGYDRVDLAAAKEKGIPVTNTPGVNAQAVGELAFGLILSVARNIPFLNSEMRSGKWVRSTGIELKGKTLGIMGLGAIGKVVARCAQGFGMEAIAYDPFINQRYCKENKITPTAMEQLIEVADVITLHLPLTAETTHLINKETISHMRDGAIIVNASRGGIIQEDDIYEALKSGKIGGLGLDAFEIEPPTNSPLFTLSNVVATPHTGAHTREATENMAETAVRNIIDVLSGNDCPFIVNK